MNSTLCQIGVKSLGLLFSTIVSLTKDGFQPVEESDSEPSSKGAPAAPAAKVATKPVPPPVKKPVVGKGKWEGEDEEESDPVVRVIDDT